MVGRVRKLQQDIPVSSGLRFRVASENEKLIHSLSSKDSTYLESF